MCVAPAQAVDVQIELRRLRKRTPEMFGKLDGEVSDHLPARLHFIDQVEPAGQIDDRTTQRLIHRHERLAIAIYPGLVTQRLHESLAQGDSDVFDRVMIVDFEIAFANDLQVEEAVLGEQVEHVLEKRHADRNSRLPRAVEIELDRDVRFFRLAMNVCDSCFSHRFHGLNSGFDRFLQAFRN